MGYKWEATQNFFLNRLPIIFKFYLLSPVKGQQDKGIIKESLSISGLIKALQFVAVGIIGYGQI